MSQIQEFGWSQIVEALTSAPGDTELAQRYAGWYSVLTGQQLQVFPIEEARAPWLGMSRGHAPLKQAVDWDQLRIVGRGQPHQLDGVRGSLWRLAMAFSGWEPAGRAALWKGTQQKGFEQRYLTRLFDRSTTLAPPWSNPQRLPAGLRQSPAIFRDDRHPLPDILTLGYAYVGFVPRMSGEPHRLHTWAVLSCLRNLVAHGALSFAKAQHWGLVPLCAKGVAVLHILFRRLVAACLASGEVAGYG